MTAKETLQKYGLKTDVKSIKERIFNIGDFGECSNALYKSQLIKSNGFYSIKMLTECHTADLSLLCEIAEKGEKTLTTSSKQKKTNKNETEKNI